MFGLQGYFLDLPLFIRLLVSYQMELQLHLCYNPAWPRCLVIKGSVFFFSFSYLEMSQGDSVHPSAIKRDTSSQKKASESNNVVFYRTKMGQKNLNITTDFFSHDPNSLQTQRCALSSIFILSVIIGKGDKHLSSNKQYLHYKSLARNIPWYQLIISLLIGIVCPDTYWLLRKVASKHSQNWTQNFHLTSRLHHWETLWTQKELSRRKVTVQDCCSVHQQ